MPPIHHSTVAFALLMLLAIGLAAVTATPLHLSRGQHATASERPAPKLTTFVEGQFLIDFACDKPKQPGFCDQAVEAIRKACRRLQSQLKFKRPIKALMGMHLPCGSDRLDLACLENEWVGLASPAGSVPIKHKDDGVVYDYPTVLLRQLDIVSDETSIAWPQYDMRIAFNQAYEFWFDDDMAPSSRHSHFEATALHELIHGLGFGMASVLPMQPSGNNGSTALVVPTHNPFPRLFLPDNVSIPFDLDWSPYYLRFYEFVRPSIYDRFLRVANKTAGSRPGYLDFIAQMQGIVNRLVKAGTIQPMTAGEAKAASDKLDKTPEEKALVANSTQVAYSSKAVYAALEADREARALMSAMHSALTTPSTVHFDYSQWPVAARQLAALLPAFNLTSSLIMETSFANFSDASLSHVQRHQVLIDRERGVRRPVDVEPFDFGHEFLMTWASVPLSLHELATMTNTPSGIGPKTLGVLVAMGYTPAAANEWVSRKDAAELVRDEVLPGTPLGPPEVAKLPSPSKPEPQAQPNPGQNSASVHRAGWMSVGIAIVGVMAAI